MPKDDQKKDWLCKFTFCKGRNGEHLRNFGWRKSCWSCGIAKGTAHFKDVAAAPPRSHRANGKSDDKQAARILQLEQKVRELRAERPGPGPGPTPSAETEGKPDKRVEATAEIAKLRKDIQKLESVECIDEMLQRAIDGKRERLHGLQLEKQACLPVHQQLRDIQAKIDRKEKTAQRRRQVELPQLEAAIDEAQKRYDKAMAEVDALEANLVTLNEQKEKLLASPVEEACSTTRFPPGSMEGADGEAFAAVLGRLAVVVEALPRAYHAGNMHTAYDGIMEHLQELVALAPSGSQEVGEVAGAAAAPVPSTSIASDDEFPEDSDVELEEEHVEEAVSAVTEVDGLDPQKRSQRVREIVQDVVRRAKRAKRSSR